MKRGGRGLVTDGGLRNTPRFRELNLPAYIRALHTTTSSLQHHPADMQVPTGCAEVMVIPGDVIVQNAKGVALVPAHVAEEVAHGAYEPARQGEVRPAQGTGRNEEFAALRRSTTQAGGAPPLLSEMNQSQRCCTRWLSCVLHWARVSTSMMSSTFVRAHKENCPTWIRCCRRSG